MYDEKAKLRFYKWRENNKDEYLAKQRQYQKDHYWKYKGKAEERRKLNAPTKKEFKAFLNILLD